MLNLMYAGNLTEIGQELRVGNEMHFVLSCY